MLLMLTTYWGITLSPVISKLFEYGVMEKYDTYFPENDRQFGFKGNMGSCHAEFVLRQCVECFVSRCSTVGIYGCVGCYKSLR